MKSLEERFEMIAIKSIAKRVEALKKSCIDYSNGEQKLEFRVYTERNNGFEIILVLGNIVGTKWAHYRTEIWIADGGDKVYSEGSTGDQNCMTIDRVKLEAKKTWDYCSRNILNN